jgi:hypothetical protein
MCSNASKTVASLMAAIQPGLINLLTVTGIASTTQGQAAIKAYDAALAAVEAWVPGTTAQDVIQVIDAFTAVFDTLPFPSEVSVLVNIVSAGIVTVIGVLTGNSPAPAAPAGATASTEEAQDAHAVAVAHDTTVKVQALVPGFKRSIWHSPASQYKTAWNNGVARVAKANPKYATLKYA